jgi:hypothetical protein
MHVGGGEMCEALLSLCLQFGNHPLTVATKVYIRSSQIRDPM